ncbi:MAG: hypothetical protein FJ297_14870 [Planctomycetes bacterium]|nr:hypothetical protein [Planctomycetota bacterium]
MSERILRGPAQDRKTGRTSKTTRGARRRTVISSVLESVRRYVPKFTLADAIQEIVRWQTAGISCFQALLNQLTGRHGGDSDRASRKSVLDERLPVPAG